MSVIIIVLAVVAVVGGIAFVAYTKYNKAKSSSASFTGGGAVAGKLERNKDGIPTGDSNKNKSSQ
jgi:hypothetical protein